MPAVGPKQVYDKYAQAELGLGVVKPVTSIIGGAHMRLSGLAPTFAAAGEPLTVQFTANSVNSADILRDNYTGVVEYDGQIVAVFSTAFVSVKPSGKPGDTARVSLSTRNVVTKALAGKTLTVYVGATGAFQNVYVGQRFKPVAGDALAYSVKVAPASAASPSITTSVSSGPLFTNPSAAPPVTTTTKTPSTGGNGSLGLGNLTTGEKLLLYGGAGLLAFTVVAKAL